MTPEQALQILDRAAAIAPLSRTDHVAVQKAVEVLAAALKAKEKPAA